MLFFWWLLLVSTIHSSWNDFCIMELWDSLKCSHYSAYRFAAVFIQGCSTLQIIWMMIIWWWIQTGAKLLSIIFSSFCIIFRNIIRHFFCLFGNAPDVEYVKLFNFFVPAELQNHIYPEGLIKTKTNPL